MDTHSNTCQPTCKKHQCPEGFKMKNEETICGDNWFERCCTLTTTTPTNPNPTVCTLPKDCPAPYNSCIEGFCTTTIDPCNNVTCPVQRPYKTKVTTPEGIITCECHQNFCPDDASYVNGKCVCSDGSYPINYVCKTVVPPIIGPGHICELPWVPNPSNTGCMCHSPFKQFQDGICGCEYPWIPNSTNDGCNCPKPFIEENGVCFCEFGAINEEGDCVEEEPRITCGEVFDDQTFAANRPDEAEAGMFSPINDKTQLCCPVDDYDNIATGCLESDNVNRLSCFDACYIPNSCRLFPIPYGYQKVNTSDNLDKSCCMGDNCEKEHNRCIDICGYKLETCKELKGRQNENLLIVKGQEETKCCAVEDIKLRQDCEEEFPSCNICFIHNTCSTAPTPSGHIKISTNLKQSCCVTSVDCESNVMCNDFCFTPIIEESTCQDWFKERNPKLDILQQLLGTKPCTMQYVHENLNQCGKTWCIGTIDPATFDKCPLCTQNGGVWDVSEKRCASKETCTERCIIHQYQCPVTCKEQHEREEYFKNSNQAKYLQKTKTTPCCLGSNPHNGIASELSNTCFRHFNKCEDICYVEQKNCQFYEPEEGYKPIQNETILKKECCTNRNSWACRDGKNLCKDICVYKPLTCGNVEKAENWVINTAGGFTTKTPCCNNDHNIDGLNACLSEYGSRCDQCHIQHNCSTYIENRINFIHQNTDVNKICCLSEENCKGPLCSTECSVEILPIKCDEWITMINMKLPFLHTIQAKKSCYSTLNTDEFKRCGPSLCFEKIEVNNCEKCISHTGHWDTNNNQGRCVQNCGKYGIENPQCFNTLDHCNGQCIYNPPTKVQQQCNKSCGGGKKKTYISTAKFTPVGKECKDVETIVDCNIQECPVNCILSEWSEWKTKLDSKCKPNNNDECGTSKGSITKIRTKEIIQEGKGNGIKCMDLSNIEEHTQPCNVPCRSCHTNYTGTATTCLCLFPFEEINTVNTTICDCPRMKIYNQATNSCDVVTITPTTCPEGTVKLNGECKICPSGYVAVDNRCISTNCQEGWAFDGERCVQCVSEWSACSATCEGKQTRRKINCNVAACHKLPQTRDCGASKCQIAPGHCVTVKKLIKKRIGCRYFRYWQYTCSSTSVHCTVKKIGYRGYQCVPTCQTRACPIGYTTRDMYSPCEKSDSNHWLEQCCRPTGSGYFELKACNNHQYCAGGSKCQADGFCGPKDSEQTSIGTDINHITDVVIISTGVSVGINGSFNIKKCECNSNGPSRYYGRADCSSTYPSWGGRRYCYITPGSNCNDATESNRYSGHSFSYEACSTVSISNIHTGHTSHSSLRNGSSGRRYR
jgi:hypothetical protein